MKVYLTNLTGERLSGWRSIQVSDKHDCYKEIVNSLKDLHSVYGVKLSSVYATCGEEPVNESVLNVLLRNNVSNHTKLFIYNLINSIGSKYAIRNSGKPEIPYMFVRVVSVKMSTYWYADKIGEVIKVIRRYDPTDERDYQMIDAWGKPNGSYLDKDDVYVLPVLSLLDEDLVITADPLMTGKNVHSITDNQDGTTTVVFGVPTFTIIISRDGDLKNGPDQKTIFVTKLKNEEEWHNLRVCMSLQIAHLACSMRYDGNGITTKFSGSNVIYYQEYCDSLLRVLTSKDLIISTSIMGR